MNISDLIFNVGVLFIMMIPGVVLRLCKLCPDGFGKGISNLVLYIAQPALIVHSYLNCDRSFSEIWFNSLVVLILSVLAHVIFALAAIPVFKKAEISKGRMLKFATVFSNAAFMGMALVQSILGAEATIYASIYNITFNLFLWTLGVHFCTHEQGKDMDGDGDSDLTDAVLSAKHHIKRSGGFVKVLLHPVILASVIGVALFVCGVTVPKMEAAGLGIISDSLLMLKNLVAPLSMVVIGLRLPDVRLTGFFSDVYMYVFLVLRHLLLPLAVLGVCKLTALMGVEVTSEVLMVTMLLACAPAASSATMFAEKYNCDAVYVSRLVVVSTAISILTMPLVIALSML